MSALGQFLLEQRWIQKEELADALLTQQEVGGRLGTSLLEKGYVSEELLLKALSEQQSTPTAGATDLARIPPDVIALLSTKLASRHLAIPFRAFGSRVDVALARTDNLAQIDEIAFAMGKTIRAHVAVEARLYHALEHYYRVPCPRRFRGLIDTLDNRRQAAPYAAGPGANGISPGHPAARRSESRRSGPRRFVPGLRVPDQRSIPLTEDQRRSLDQTSGSTGEETGSLMDDLAEADSPEEIGRLLLTAMDEHFIRSLLFRVARRSVSGWLGHGPEIDRDWLAGYSVGLRQPTVFRQVEKGSVFRGELASNPPHDSLARCWGGGLDHECLVTAVRVRGRMVCVLYGDRGRLGLAGLDSTTVERLSAKAGLAFERLILDRKLRR